ncbi:hypothetical protein JCM31447_28030 [Fluviispira sanaruensis]|uniref:Uncharacterized protein n=1 Tax=Fluviispira sanaruensis TaxID=2493639 RepID=A0A4P2VQM1_FLUSA|nr:hypothetical protein JCM31447_28030 [Fluviispira sanaruensis]
MIGKTKIGKGTKNIQIVDKKELLDSLYIDFANLHESHLLMKTIKWSRLLRRNLPQSKNKD